MKCNELYDIVIKLKTEEMRGNFFKLFKQKIFNYFFLKKT